jgi:hypothetical protein
MDMMVILFCEGDGPSVINATNDEGRIRQPAGLHPPDHRRAEWWRRRIRLLS